MNALKFMLDQNTSTKPVNEVRITSTYKYTLRLSFIRCGIMF